MTEESKAFFSYSRLDAEFALKLAKDLRNAGAVIWIDQLDIAPGAHWDIAVQKAVGGSSSLLVVLSPHAVESENVMDEVAYAIEEKKLVIPVLYRKCDIPLRLRRLQYIDVQADYDGGLQKIVTQLEAHRKSAAGSTIESPRPTTAEWEAIQARAESQAREREQFANADPVAQEQEPQPTPRLRTTPAAPARSGSSRKIIWTAVGGSIFILLLIAVIASMSHRPEHSRTTGSPARELPSTPAGAEPVRAASHPSSRPDSSEASARPDLHQWLLDALTASQGPSVDALRPYFDETVSPYYSMPSADWTKIAADKEAYFNRFPEIHYQLLMWKHTPQADGSEVIEYDVSYRAVRNDGVSVHGASHSVATVRFKGGVWKITSIR